VRYQLPFCFLSRTGFRIVGLYKKIISGFSMEEMLGNNGREHIYSRGVNFCFSVKVPVFYINRNFFILFTIILHKSDFLAGRIQFQSSFHVVF